jgi:hypothetical protein
MDQSSLLAMLHRTPSVHQLCYGVFLQEALEIAPDLWAVPLQSLGFAAEANYTVQYGLQIAGVSFDQTAVQNMVEQGGQALPVVAIVRFLNADAAPEELERNSSEELQRTRRILSWSTGDELTPFAMLVCTTTRSFTRILPPSSRRRLRLGFGNTGDDFNQQVGRIYSAAMGDQHFEYALSLLHDAHRELNPVFKIARLFNCLECLASSLKAKHGGASRKAVKDLLDLPEGAMSEEVIGDKRYRYDPVEIAGRVRDKVFHGASFREEHLNAESKHVFELLQLHPESLISAMLAYCELEIARWANGVSRGRGAASKSA